MIRRNCRQVRAASYIKLITNSKGAARDPLDFLGTEVRNNSLPLPDGSGTDVERPRDIRGTLKVINNVLLEHEPTFTTVKNAMQPQCQSKDLTLVDMDKYATIADRLRSSMAESGISGSDLARACDVSPAAVHKWLNGGKMSADNSAAAARALGVREEWLRTGKLPKEREHGYQEQSLDQVMDLLEELKGPLAALAAAIEKIGKTRPAIRKRSAS